MLRLKAAVNVNPSDADKLSAEASMKKLSYIDVFEENAKIDLM